MQPIHIETTLTPDAQDADIGGALSLPASIGLAELDALHVALTSRIASDVAVIVDASDVDRASTPCIQLLVAAAAAARASGLAFEIANVPAKFHGAIADLGLCGTLGLANA